MVLLKRVRRNTGPGFSVKACVFHVFLRIASIKTIGSRMEISYVFFCDQMFEIMILASTSHQCRGQALRITWTSSRKPFTLPDRSR